MDALANPLNPNKRLKEEFVSNLTGSSMLEIAALSAIVPALVVLRQWSGFATAKGHLYIREVMKKKDDNVPAYLGDWRKYVLALTMDFFCVILPVLAFFTVLSDWVCIYAILLIVLILFFLSAKRLRSPSIQSKEELQLSASLRTNILSYRVSVVVVTCLCILAVDFKVFPRRYAKTETYGTGLMDLGVGSFVLANSLVSRQARKVFSVRMTWALFMPFLNFFIRIHSMSSLLKAARRWDATLRSAGPLIFLGFGRLISTTGVDYQVHVGEYGVHWNFFFTLAAVSILTSLINIHAKYCGIFGFLILIGYQISLLYGLSGYLISNERADGIISQNKEGLCSILGYWALYLFGVHLGYHIFFASDSAKIGGLQKARIEVWVLSTLFWSLTIIFDKYVERVSRRTCNLAYVTFVLAQNFEVLSILMLSDFISGQKPLLLEEAFNQNLLASFLLANVFTGIVNLFVDTLSTSSCVALCILFVYAFILSAAVGFAFFYRIKLKFW